MARSRFVYADRTAEDVDARNRQVSQYRESFIIPEVPTFKARDGENIIRIMPPTWHGDEKLVERWGNSWDITCFVHYSIGADGGAFLCLDKMLGKPCPICDVRDKSDDEDDRSALQWTPRPIAYLIDRKDEKKGPQVWPMPVKKVYQEITTRSKDKKSNAIVRIEHEEEGYDVFFHVEGQGLRKQYTAVDIDRDPSPLSDNDKQFNRWVDFIEANPLHDILVYHEYDYIMKVLMGTAEPDDGDRPRIRKDRDRDKDKNERGGRGREEEDRRSSGQKRGDDEGESRRPRRGSNPEEEEDRRSRSGRGEDEDQGSRRRGRGDDEEEDRRSRKSRDRDEEADQPRNRSQREAPEEDAPPRRTSGRSGGGKVDDEEGGSIGRRSLSEASNSDEEGDEPPRRGKSNGRSSEEDEPPFETKGRGRARGSEDGGDGTEEEPASQAKRGLAGLKDRYSRRPA